jgi:hypothetical protein
MTVEKSRIFIYEFIILAIIIVFIAFYSFNAHKSAASSTKHTEFRPKENFTNLNGTCIISGSNINVSLAGCKNLTVYNYSYKNTAVCKNGMHLQNLILENFTYNNTISNCSINQVYEYHSGINFVFGDAPIGYQIIGNSSKLIIGYYIRFVPHLINGTIQTKFPNIIKITSLSGNEPILNWTFGHYYGIASIPIETELITNNTIINYNPYHFIAPDWGWDILTTRTLNITDNINETPNFIKYANITIFSIFPDNREMWINFTVIPYQPKVITAVLLNGIQNEVGTIPIKYFYNITAPILIRYKVGIQNKGLYSFTPMLLNGLEVDNSSGLTYSVGLTYCNRNNITLQNAQGVINNPGYYSFASSKLVLLNGPHLTNDSLCSIGAIIKSGNVTINCMGGSITANYSAFYIDSAKNVTIENCRLYGNGVYALNSGVRILNTTISNNALVNQKFGIYESNSSIEIENDNISGNWDIGYKK